MGALFACCLSTGKKTLSMNLLKSLAAVSSITMLSRVLGFVRDTLIARAFGAGMATDAFFIAFKLPNLLRRIFAEGAFSQAFVPILAEYKKPEGRGGDANLHCLRLGPADAGAGAGHRVGHARRALGHLGHGTGFRHYPGKKFELTTDLLRVTFSLYIADLPVFIGWSDPQYLEPFLGPGLRADPAQCQHDHLCGVPDAVFRSAGNGAGLGRSGGWPGAIAVSAAAPEEKSACWCCRA